MWRTTISYNYYVVKGKVQVKMRKYIQETNSYLKNQDKISTSCLLFHVICVCIFPTYVPRAFCRAKERVLTSKDWSYRRIWASREAGYKAWIFWWANSALKQQDYLFSTRMFETSHIFVYVCVSVEFLMVTLTGGHWWCMILEVFRLHWSGGNPRLYLHHWNISWRSWI